MCDPNEIPERNIVFISFRSFQCVPILGRGFETGGYKCECRQGFEYPFEDPIIYFDGQLVEAEFVNMVKDRETKYGARIFVSLGGVCTVAKKAIRPSRGILRVFCR